MNQIRITITFDPGNGQIGLQGPIQDPILFMGMLEMAKAALLEARAKAVSAIVPIQGMPPQLPPGRKG